MIDFLYVSNFIEKRMQGELFINNKDAWVNWSVRLVDASYDNLENSAPMKAYVENNSRVYSGKQVFISNPKEDSRNVILIFAITCDSRIEFLTKKRDFEREIKTGLCEFKIPNLLTIYKLHLDENSTFDLTTGLGMRDGKYSIRFTEKDISDRQAYY